jgi:hypothetical protein
MKKMARSLMKMPCHCAIYDCKYRALLQRSNHPAVRARAQRTIFKFCRKSTGKLAEALRFFNALELEAFAHAQDLADSVAVSASLIWSSQLLLVLQDGSRTEFCGVLNRIMRELDHDCVVVRAINSLFVLRHVSHHIPMFLVTSFSPRVADNFSVIAAQRGDPPVIWTVKVVQRGTVQLMHRCKHVNKVSTTNVQGEFEFLYAPYSVCTVESVTPAGAAPTPVFPIQITIAAAVDNQGMPHDLPLAPWA